jgi:hypothetical protein
MMDAIVVPRCSHDRIILSCPNDDCPEQNAYLADMQSRWDAIVEMQENEAKKLVRPWAADWSR